MKKYFSLSVLFILVSISTVLCGINPLKITSELIQRKNMIVLPWIVNNGQYNNKVLFTTKTKVADIAVLESGKIEYFLTLDSGKKILFSESILNGEKTNNIFGKNKTETKFNFFKNHKGLGNISCSAYNTIDFGEIFSGISLSIETRRKNIEKIFKIKPHSNPAHIKLKLAEIEDLCVNDKGELQLEIAGRTVSFTRPLAWQVINDKKINIQVKYDIKDDFVYGFLLGKYDPEYTLYIDPLLSSTFIGGSNMDLVKSLAVSNTGKVYAGGVTSSTDFPVTPGSFNNDFNGQEDIFIALFDSSLTNLEVCSFIGGQGQDILADMKLDNNDNVYFCGWTDSEDYPVSSLAYDTIFNNPGNPYSDIVISCLDSKLSELKYSTFVGSELGDQAFAFDFDANFDLIVTGISDGGIPVVGTQFYPETKKFIFFKIDSHLKNLLATNSIQTDDITIPVDLVTEASQTVFITGYTEDPGFPVTPGAYMDTLTGNSDVFVIRLSNDLSVLERSTFLGGKKDEVPSDIILDRLDNIILAGSTKSKSFPVTTNAYDTIIANPDSEINDVFICMMDYSLMEIKASTFLGGQNEEISGQLLLDDAENVYLSGTTNSKDFPVFCNSLDDSFNGRNDGFIVKISPKFEYLLGSTFVGGDDDDYCYSLAKDIRGNIFSAGFTASVDFPVFSGFDNFYNGDSGDGFIIKMTSDLQKPYPCCTHITEPVPESTDNPRIVNLVWEQSVGATGYLLSIGTTQDTFNMFYKYDLTNQTSYIWDGFNCGDTVYVKISPYNDFGINETCDTIWFVIRPPFENIEDISICEGDSVEWQGSYYSETGIYTESYMDTEGCDSTYTLNLNVYPNYFNSDEADICEGDSYFWQGEYYSVAGDYTKHYTTINGCDSIFELQLDVLPSYLFEFDTTICKGETVIWQNYSLTSAGIYTSEFQTINGCDSIYQLILTVLPSYNYEEEAGICQGDTLNWQGMVLDSSGIYTVHYSTLENCDSNYSLKLTVFPNYHYEEEAVICSADTFIWQGMALSEAGTYNVSYTTVNDCDSSYQLVLTILPSYNYEEEAGICQGDTLNWQGMALDSTGIYTVHYSTLENCDSNYSLKLTVFPNYHYEEEAVICSADTFMWQGMELSEAGTYNVSYTTINDCDSSYQLVLTVLPSYNYEEEAGICQGDTLYWQGMALDSTGIYTVHYSTIENCDSNYRLNLIVFPEYYFEEEVTICEGGTLEWHGMNIDSSGSYYDAYSTIMGCDSIYKINVETKYIDNTIVQSGDTLFAVYDSTLNYQWVICPAFDIIIGAKEYKYVTLESNSYAVIISKGDCSKISECINVINSGIDNPGLANKVKIYPNPVFGNEMIIESKGLSIDYITIRDFTGKNVEKCEAAKNLTRINTTKLSQGIYFISIFTSREVINKKFVVVR